jgi:hypothetical protein
MKQHGYVLLLVLSILIGGSGLWLSNEPLHDTRGEQQRRQALMLIRARDALISYAVSYIDLYGPRGAGPGHFPCPDTDSPGSANANSPWRGDSPDPPCGHGLVASGRLPRHVSLATHRYVFHTNAKQELTYSVSTRFINNPTNRVVHPGKRGTLRIDSSADVVAVITAANQQKVLLRSADLRLPMMQRVGAWLLATLHMPAPRACNTEALACTLATPDDNQCQGIDVAAEPASHAVTITGVALLEWLADDDTMLPAACDDGAPSQTETEALLEGVVLQYHWFVRNVWHAYVDLQLSPQCQLPSAVACRFHLQGLLPDAERLSIVLQPAEPGSAS